MQVAVSGLPFSADFRAAVYRGNYVMVHGYPRFDLKAQNPSHSASYRPAGERLQSATPRSLRGESDGETVAEPGQRSDADVDSSDESGKCPEVPTGLPVATSAIARGAKMATGFVSDATLQCMLRALHAQGLLKAAVRDGDVPNVRCLHVVYCRYVKREQHS